MGAALTLALAGCSAGAPSAASGAEPIVTVTIAAGGDEPGSDATVIITVTADPAPVDDLEVAVRVTGTSADMDPETVTATVAAGQSEAQFSVPVERSQERTVTAEVLAGSGYTVGGESSASVTVAADPLQVAAPTVISTETGSESITVTWKEPDTSLIVTGYAVRWCDDTGSCDEQDDLASDARSYAIPGLMPETAYTVQVRALFGDDAGLWSEPIAATTRPSRVSPVVLPLVSISTNKETYSAYLEQAPLYGSIGLIIDSDLAAPSTDMTIRIRLDETGPDRVNKMSGEHDYVLTAGNRFIYIFLVLGPAFSAEPTTVTFTLLEDPAYRRNESASEVTVTVTD
ncbi:MAG: fibronectin type III domain-containing protein [Spirochaetaceae bacterium]|nr:fibronectin type III domain-containing protein [Spirochaetaceae bacterium]